jgi:hypothetical protein
MSDEQLPPEGRLTDQQRARLRAGLLEQIGGERRRPWLVPVAAAAAVALLIGGGTVIGLAMTGPGGPSSSRQVGPAGGGPDSSSPADPGSATPSDSPSVVTDTETVSSATPSLPVPTYGPKGQGSCDHEVPTYLPGATMRSAYEYGDGYHTYLYATPDKWVVCDTWATTDGGPPTVTAVHSFGEPLDKDQVLISQNYSMDEGQGAQYFAAGARIPGVSSMQFSFPDGDWADGGHIVLATFTDDMWVMQYLPAKAPSRAPDLVKVAVVRADNSAVGFNLGAMDLCAQVNHGC